MSGHYFFKLLILIVFYYKYGVFWLFFGCFLGFYFQQSHDVNSSIINLT
ncbi:hypothetical protein [uncultured Gammaproteobacteria bacterium]|nr:hypothetical protein [uncultured Gammaproteobacteria bacterium]CAC9657933.1 hypothetical protein [uncultured Gammaproteobacteria bacterium]